MTETATPPAGPALDAEVSRRVFKQPAEVYPAGAFIALDGPAGGYRRVRSYSTDIEAAWLVVERLRADGWTLSLTVESTFSSAPSMAVFRRGVEAHGWPFVCLVNAPEAICRAALVAVAAEGGA